MKAALISLESVSSRMTLKALSDYFNEVDSINLKNIEVGLGTDTTNILIDGQPIEDYDCIYAKGSFRYSNLLRSITRALQYSTYMPLKPHSFTIGHDKLLTHLALQNHKIPMPLTYLASSTKSAKDILQRMNYPIIMKFPHGTGGKGVMYSESFAAASSMLDALTTLRQPFLIQEYIETNGVDLRLIMVGNEVVAAMKRKADIREKRANIHSGGKGEKFAPDNHTQKIAMDAAKAVGAEICAVDILESVKGPLVIEVNLSPGLQGITAATGIDVADKIAAFLHKRAQEFSEKGKEKGTTKILEDLGLGSPEDEKQIISNLDFRGTRVLLPKFVTDLTRFNEKDEYLIKTQKGKLIIEKSGK